jgi:hypothetical protein
LLTIGQRATAKKKIRKTKVNTARWRNFFHVHFTDGMMNAFSDSISVINCVQINVEGRLEEWNGY